MRAPPLLPRLALQLSLDPGDISARNEAHSTELRLPPTWAPTVVLVALSQPDAAADAAAALIQLDRALLLPSESAEQWHSPASVPFYISNMLA